jgi:hypothetical protein
MSLPSAEPTNLPAARRPGLSTETAREYALVRVAVELDAQEAEALRTALTKLFRRPVELEIEVRPDILGGVWVRLSDTVIDGSLRGQLETLRHHLRSQTGATLTSTPSEAPQRVEP